jgi:uncharacterized membrane protein YagU involved in acid resistance
MNASIFPVRLLKAALFAGIVAGTVATLAQLLLWWLAAAPLPETFYRDTRLAAAIVLPQSIIAPGELLTLPDWAMLAAATVLHFALSVIYAAAFILLARRLRLKASRLPLAGLLFGLALYLVNMYGFTLLFPWFALVRDWITLAAHLVFGLGLALAVGANTRFNVPLLPI